MDAASRGARRQALGHAPAPWRTGVARGDDRCLRESQPREGAEFGQSSAEVPGRRVDVVDSARGEIPGEVA
eukprot:4731518-Pyramimonas_sp.AAC.1